MSTQTHAQAKAPTKLSVSSQQKGLLQRRATQEAEPATVPPVVHEVLNSPGQPLDASSRAFMEPHFGHDFSRVRVHNDEQAAESARAVNANAYTAGDHVVFDTGQYAPGTDTGQRLMAHELTHVVQQDDEDVPMRSGLELGATDTWQEYEAEEMMQNISTGGKLGAIHSDQSVLRRQEDEKKASTSSKDVQRYPTDPQAWQDIELLPIVEDQLPHTDFSPSGGSISSGIYRIHPQLRNHDDPHVVYYIAYNTRARRSEFAIGPAYLDFFLQHTIMYMIAAGNFFGISGPSPYEVSTGKVISRGMRGDIRGAVRALGQAWLQALQDPNWWIQALGATAGMAAPEAEAASAEGKVHPTTEVTSVEGKAPPTTEAATIEGKGTGKVGTVAETKVVATAEGEVLAEGPTLPKSVGAAADITVESKIGKSTYAIRQAEAMGEAAQADADHLLAELKKGNANPGIGTRSLGDGFYELRGRNGGRVIVKQTSAGSFDIVGKFQGHIRGASANSGIIKKLMEVYKP